MNTPAKGSDEEHELSMRLSRIEKTLINDDRGPGLDIRQLVTTLWEGKWFILSITSIVAILAVVITLRMPNQYKAAVMLVPVSSSSMSSMSRLAGQFGGLAALAGISLGGAGNGENAVAAMELVKSWGFQEEFIRDNQAEAAVFAARGWDRGSDRLIFDPTIYDETQRKWVRRFRPEKGETAEPNGWELHKKFSNRIAIIQNPKTNLITLSVEFYSPQLAKDWADGIVKAINLRMQERDRAEAAKSIEYLQKKMAQTGLTEMKTVFSRLIEEQTKTLMLADVSDEYVFKTLGPAKLPVMKSGPARGLICIVATLVGGFLATACWLVWSAIRRS